MADGKKVVIITGSTGGIGLELAKHLHGKGYKVALTGRRVELGEKEAKGIDPTGETVFFAQCDVASYESQAKAFKAVWNKWSRLDVVVSNAGHVDKGSLYNFSTRSNSVDDIPATPDLGAIDTDLKGTIYSTVLATHFMRHNKTPGGKIIVTGSMIGVHPCQTFPEYCSAKAGAHHFTRVMGPILQSKENIQMNCVMPAGVATPAIPGFELAFKPEHLTTMPNLMATYDIFLDDAYPKSGQTVEAGHDTVFWHEVPPNLSGSFGERTMAVYEPWFAMFHGEKSDLPGGILKSPRE